MRFVTVQMIADHAHRHRGSVIRAMKAAGYTLTPLPGCKGHRILERDANKFLLRQWPEAGPFPPLAQ